VEERLPRRERIKLSGPTRGGRRIPFPIPSGAPPIDRTTLLPTSDRDGWMGRNAPSGQQHVATARVSHWNIFGAEKTVWSGFKPLLVLGHTARFGPGSLERREEGLSLTHFCGFNSDTCFG
jgi:hypothetical protein